MAEREIGRAVVEVIPTLHLMERCRERLGDLSPGFETGRRIRLSGVLVEPIRGRKPLHRLYLDVDGIGRFVIARSRDCYVGITYIPQLHCHGPVSSSNEPFVDRPSRHTAQVESR